MGFNKTNYEALKELMINNCYCMRGLCKNCYGSDNVEYCAQFQRQLALCKAMATDTKVTINKAENTVQIEPAKEEKLSPQVKELQQLLIKEAMQFRANFAQQGHFDGMPDWIIEQRQRDYIAGTMDMLKVVSDYIQQKEKKR